MYVFPISLHVMPCATPGLFHTQGAELELLSQVTLGSGLRLHSETRPNQVHNKISICGLLACRPGASVLISLNQFSYLHKGRVSDQGTSQINAVRQVTTATVSR